MLAGRSNFLGKAIIDHPQYQPFLEVPLVFGTEADEAKVKEAILHLTTDSEAACGCWPRCCNRLLRPQGGISPAFAAGRG